MLEETRIPFEDGRRAGQAAAREQRRKHRIARGFGVGESLPVGQRLDPGLRHRDVIVDGETDGLRELRRRELHQLAGGERHGRQAEHRRVPAAGRDVEGVDQAAVDLVGEHDRGDELRSARALAFGDREAGGDVIARMARQTPDVGIVQVVVAEGCAVGEGGEIGRGAPVRADDGRCAGRRDQRDIAADAHRPLVERGDSAADRVDEMRFDPLDGRCVEIVIAQSIGVGGEPIRERPGGRLRSSGFRRRKPWRQSPETEGSHAGDEATARDRVEHVGHIGQPLRECPPPQRANTSLSLERTVCGTASIARMSLRRLRGEIVKSGMYPIAAGATN